MPTRLLLATGFLLTLSSCFGAEALQQASSGYTGCSSDEITISNDTPGFNQRSWDASCRGHAYHCSAINKGGMSCREDHPATISSEPAGGETPRGEAKAGVHVWQRFVAKDCAVSVDLPGEPEERRPTARSGSRAGPYSATVEVDDGLVALGCEPRPSGSDDNHLLNSVRDAALQAIGATFSSEFDVEGPGFRGRETQFVLGREHGRMRMLARHGEVITMVLAPTRAFSKQEAVRFFESLADSPAIASPATAPTRLSANQAGHDADLGRL